MSANNLAERLSTLVNIADDAGRTISTINSSFTLVDNLRRLLSSLTIDSNDLAPWEQNLELAEKSAPSFEQRREERINTLLNVQSAVAQATRKNYEQQGFSLDINPSFFTQLIPSAVSAVGLITVVDGYLTRREMRKGFDSLNQKLDAGFEIVTNTLKTGFSELNAKFDWGFSELMWRFDQQAEIEREIRDYLANIDKNIEKIGETQARELRIKGIEHYLLGELEEARKALLIAIENPANLADYTAEFYLGNIFLYQSNYDQAIFYYGESARHAEPRSKTHYVSALMHQGFAYYIADRDNKNDDFRCAADCLRKAIDAEPHCAELKYQLAQYQALSGDISDALDNLDIIIRSEPKYIVKILAEADFVEIRPQIEEMLLSYDKELSEIFFKLFNDLTDILSQLTKIYDSQGLPINNLSNLTEPSNLSFPGGIDRIEGPYEIHGEVIGCDWELYVTPSYCWYYKASIRPRKSSILEEIYLDSKNVLSKIEEIIEIYKRGDILSKKVSCDLLAEISFTSLKIIPFDIKTGKLSLRYRANWLVWTHGLSWVVPEALQWHTTEHAEDIYVGIGGDRI